MYDSSKSISGGGSLTDHVPRLLPNGSGDPQTQNNIHRMFCEKISQLSQTSETNPAFERREATIPCLIPSLTTPALSAVVVADRDTRAAPSGYETLTSSQEEEMLPRITPGVALISPSTTSQGHRHLSALPSSPGQGPHGDS